MAAPAKPRYKTVPITLPSSWTQPLLRPWYATLDAVQTPWCRFASTRTGRVTIEVHRIIGLMFLVMFRVIYRLCKIMLKVSFVVTVIVFGIMAFGVLRIDGKSK